MDKVARALGQGGVLVLSEMRIKRKRSTCISACTSLGVGQLFGSPKNDFVVYLVRNTGVKIKSNASFISVAASRSENHSTAC